MEEGQLLLGTSNWAAGGWVGCFCPPGSRPADFPPQYAKHFSTAEIDSTSYRIPSAKTVEQFA
jgi:uncharacterized protein YecE (DUF72 family)